MPRNVPRKFAVRYMYLLYVCCFVVCLAVEFTAASASRGAPFFVVGNPLAVSIDTHAFIVNLHIERVVATTNELAIRAGVVNRAGALVRCRGGVQRPIECRGVLPAAQLTRLCR